MWYRVSRGMPPPRSLLPIPLPGTDLLVHRGNLLVEGQGNYSGSRREGRWRFSRHSWRLSSSRCPSGTPHRSRLRQRRPSLRSGSPGGGGLLVCGCPRLSRLRRRKPQSVPGAELVAGPRGGPWRFAAAEVALGIGRALGSHSVILDGLPRPVLVATAPSLPCGEVLPGLAHLREGITVVLVVPVPHALTASHRERLLERNLAAGLNVGELTGRQAVCASPHPRSSTERGRSAGCTKAQRNDRDFAMRSLRCGGETKGMNGKRPQEVNHADGAAGVVLAFSLIAVADGGRVACPMAVEGEVACRAVSPQDCPPRDGRCEYRWPCSPGLTGW